MVVINRGSYAGWSASQWIDPPAKGAASLRTRNNMPSKKRCRVARFSAKPALGLTPAPQSFQDVLVLLKCAAEAAPAKTEIFTHLTEMGTLFPQEMLGAFKAFMKKQIGDN